MVSKHMEFEDSYKVVSSLGKICCISNKEHSGRYFLNQLYFHQRGIFELTLQSSAMLIWISRTNFLIFWLDTIQNSMIHRPVY